LQPASGELNNEVIYVGGAVISLYVTDEGGELPRPTKGIDICSNQLLSTNGSITRALGK